MSDILTSPGSDPLLTPEGKRLRQGDKNLIYNIPAKSTQGAGPNRGRGRAWAGPRRGRSKATLRFFHQGCVFKESKNQQLRTLGCTVCSTFTEAKS